MRARWEWLLLSPDRANGPMVLVVPLACSPSRNSIPFGTAVDDHLHRAVALVDRPRILQQQHRAQTVEANRAEMPLFDVEAEKSLAIALRRQRVELTRAAIGAVTVAQFRPLDAPFGRHHTPRVATRCADRLPGSWFGTSGRSR